MSHSAAPEKELVPARLRWALVLLVTSVLAVVTFAKVTDAPMIAQPDMGAPVIAERSIILKGELSGAAWALDLNGTVIARLAPEGGGFISGVWRALTQVRKQHRVPVNLPIRLIRFEGGRLALVDDHTGWRAELVGFGQDNARAFARLLN